MNEHDKYLMTCPSVPKLPYCPVCGKAGPTTEHHIIPRSRGGHDGPTIFLCGHGTAGCHGEAEDKRLHFDYRDGQWMWVQFDAAIAESHARDYFPDDWHPVVIRSEYDQSIPFSEGEEDEGDKLHELTQQLQDFAATANTLDWCIGSVLLELSPITSKTELKMLVEETFGLSPKSTPSFVSRRKKIARLPEEYACFGLTKLLLLAEAVEKSEQPIESLAIDLKVLSAEDFAATHLGRKTAAEKERCECPVCHKVHVCES